MVFLDSMDRKIHFNIPAEGFEFKISMFQCLILKFKFPSGTSFCLYFANDEYCSDDSNSPAERNFSPVESTDKMKIRILMF